MKEGNWWRSHDGGGVWQRLEFSSAPPIRWGPWPDTAYECDGLRFSNLRAAKLHSLSVAQKTIEEELEELARSASITP